MGEKISYFQILFKFFTLSDEEFFFITMFFSFPALLNFYFYLRFLKKLIFNDFLHIFFNCFLKIDTLNLFYYKYNVDIVKDLFLLFKMMSNCDVLLKKWVFYKHFIYMSVKSINFRNVQNIDFSKLPQCFHILIRAALAVRLEY